MAKASAVLGAAMVTRSPRLTVVEFGNGLDPIEDLAFVRGL